MYDVQTILSAYDKQGTLVQWLKNLDKVLKGSGLESVNTLSVEGGYKLQFRFANGVMLESDLIQKINTLNIEADSVKLALTDANGVLIEYYTTLTVNGENVTSNIKILFPIKGSESVIVDVDENGTAIEIHLDADILNDINRALKIPVGTIPSTELVAITPSKEQKLLTVGKGLKIENDTLSAEATGGGNYVLELTGESGTLTNEQYQAVVDNFPNVVVRLDENYVFTPLYKVGYGFALLLIINGTYSYTMLLINDNKSWKIRRETGAINSSGGGNNIAIVDELPTENIPENTIYLLNKGYADVNVYYCYGDGYMSLTEAVASSIDTTPTIYYEVVSELPSNPTATDLQAFNPIYCYIYNNVPYVYGNAGSGDMWLTVSALFAQMGQTVEDKGWTSDIASETEEGLFVTYNGSYISYIRKNGAWINLCDNNVNPEEEIELIGEHSEQGNTYLDHVIKLNEETKQVILEKLSKNPKGFIIYYPIEITGVDNAESVIVVENASVFKANNTIINIGGNGFYTTLANIMPCCVMLHVGLDNSLKFRICDIWKELLGKPVLTDIIPRIKFIY